MTECSLCQNETPTPESGTVAVCEGCETEFGHDEDFAKKFFEEKEFDSKEGAVTEFFEEREFSYISFDPACFFPLRKFILGILVRFELGANSQESTILGPLKEMLFQAYLNPTLMPESFPIFIDRNGPSGKMADEIFSGRIWKLKTHSFYYGDYRFVIFCDGRHVSPKILSQLILAPERVRAILGEPRP